MWDLPVQKPCYTRTVIGILIYLGQQCIFVNAENGRAWTHRQLDGVYRRAALKAGFSKVTLEMFGRHSWVTNKLNEGWSLTDVAHWALDRVSTIESHYANVTAAVRQSVMDINEQRAARR